MEQHKDQKQVSLTISSSIFTIAQKNYKIIVELKNYVLFVKVVDDNNALQHYEGKFSDDNIPKQFKFIDEEPATSCLFQFLQKNPEQKISFDGKGNLNLRLKALEKIMIRILPLQKVKNSVQQVLLVKDQKIAKLTDQNNQLNQTIKFLMQLNQDLQKQLLIKQAQLIKEKAVKNKGAILLQKQQEKKDKIQNRKLDERYSQYSHNNCYKKSQASQIQENISDMKKFFQDQGRWLAIGNNQVFQQKEIQQLLQLDISSVRQIQLITHLLLSEKRNNQLEFRFAFFKKMGQPHTYLESYTISQYITEENELTNITSLNLQNLPKLQHINLYDNKIDKQSRQYLERLMSQYGRPTASMDKYFEQDQSKADLKVEADKDEDQDQDDVI